MIDDMPHYTPAEIAARKATMQKVLDAWVTRRILADRYEDTPAGRAEREFDILSLKSAGTA